MSMSFEIFPSIRKLPESNEVMKLSVDLISKFLKKEQIEININVTASDVMNDNQIIFNINGIGEVYMYCNKLTELDKEFWNEEMEINKKALELKERIYASFEIGYYWSIKRTMTQPAIVSIYYGYLAIAIAILTEGIVYSDDGAWDYLKLPMVGKEFMLEYMNLENINDIVVKNNIENWLSELKVKQKKWY